MSYLSKKTKLLKTIATLQLHSCRLKITFNYLYDQNYDILIKMHLYLKYCMYNTLKNTHYFSLFFINIHSKRAIDCT